MFRLLGEFLDFEAFFEPKILEQSSSSVGRFLGDGTIPHIIRHDQRHVGILVSEKLVLDLRQWRQKCKEREICQHADQSKTMSVRPSMALELKSAKTNINDSAQQTAYVCACA